MKGYSWNSPGYKKYAEERDKLQQLRLAKGELTLKYIDDNNAIDEVIKEQERKVQEAKEQWRAKK